MTLNIIAVLLHAGKMPVFEGSLLAAGLTPADLVGDPFHVLLTATSAADFVRQGGMFGDVVPIPLPVINDVVSIGDVLLWVGIVWAITAAMTRRAAPSRASMALGATPARPMPAGEFQLGVAYATAAIGAFGGAFLRYVRTLRSRCAAECNRLHSASCLPAFVEC